MVRGNKKLEAEAGTHKGKSSETDNSRWGVVRSYWYRKMCMSEEKTQTWARTEQSDMM